jgi:hypothetical protein
MANSLYAKGREGFLDGSIDWDTNDVRIILIDEGADTIDLAADDNLDDRAGGARIATSNALDNKTVTNGTADADPETFTAVAGTTSVESIDCYKHTGVESTSRLIFNIDAATGLPVTTNGGDITVTWDNGTDKIFTL